VNDVIYLFNYIIIAIKNKFTFTPLAFSISSGSSVLCADDSFINSNNSFMRNLLYIVAFIFIIGWLVGYLGFHAGGAFHLLLLVAIVATLLNLMQEKTTV
jgi:hypothetical protein